MPLYNLDAIVLKTFPFQESDFIVTLFSPLKGKIRVIAKGCRKINSSLGKIIHPMSYGNFLMAKGKNLDVITQGKIRLNFFNIHKDLERLTHGLYALELIDRFLEEPEPSPEPFALLLNTLKELAAGQKPETLLRIYEANLLSHLGYQPELKQCIQCKNSENLAVFSFAMGGMLCLSCKEIDKNGENMDPLTLQFLKSCFSSSIQNSRPVPENVLIKIKIIFQKFIELKCEKKIASFQLLREVSRVTHGIRLS
jgi:DNA repair protein RecO (recombination protein O)